MLLSSSLEKTSFHNGNDRFSVAEVIILTKSDVTVFFQSPNMWRFSVTSHFAQQYFSPMCRPRYSHPAQDSFPLPTPYTRLTIFPRDDALSCLGQCPLELPVMKSADNSVLRTGILFTTFFPTFSSKLSERSKNCWWPDPRKS